MNEDIKKDPEISHDEKKPHNFKKLKYGTMSIVLAVVVVAVIVLLNVIITLASDRVNMAADLTTTGFYELGEKTEEYLKTLTADVNIAVMVNESVITASGDPFYKQALEILKNYPKENSHIKLEFVNLTSNPQYTQRYSQIYDGTIVQGDVVITSGSRINVTSFGEYFNYGYNDQGQQTITSSKAEQLITSAVMYVSNKNPKKAYLMNVASAEEVPTGENIKEILSGNGYDVYDWNPKLEALPSDADILIIDAPLSDFDEITVKSFAAFLENGGNYSKNIVYLANARQNDMTNMNTLLYDWGVAVNKELILTDKNQSNLIDPATPFLIKAYINTDENPFARGVSNPENAVAVMNASPIELVGEGASGATSVVSLLSTSTDSFGFNEEIYNAMITDPEVQYPAGPFNVMTVSQKGLKSEYQGLSFSNILVISDSTMLNPGLTAASYYNNGDYFISILNEMTGRSDTVSIVAKTAGDTTFDMDMEQYNTYMAVFFYVIPAIIVVIAAVVILRRRHK
jgi:hypothetical protein